MTAAVTVRRAASAWVLALAACASVPQGLDRTVRGETVEGRMSLRYTDAQTGREDGSSGRFVWTTAGDTLELSLLDPFGQTIALVRSDVGTSSITFRDGRRIDGDTPEALTERALGWTVPLHGLRYWLLGRDDPAHPSSTLPDGRLRQDGWAIRFQPSAGDAVGPLPGRIDLTFPGPPAAIELHLIVDARNAS